MAPRNAAFRASLACIIAALTLVLTSAMGPCALFVVRRLVQVPKDVEWEMKRYEDHTLHLINTDIDDLLDIDDARMASEHAEQKTQQDVAAAASATGETDTTDPAPQSTSTESSPPVEVKAGVSGSTDGKTLPDSMDVEEAAVVTQGEGAKPAGSQGRYHALCLQFTLPTAAYATMCLREITHQDTSTKYHTSLNALPPGQHPGVARPYAASEGAGGAGEGGSTKGGGAGEAKAEAKVSSPSKGTVIRVGASLAK